jgi:hypothetical protein
VKEYAMFKRIVRLAGWLLLSVAIVSCGSDPQGLSGDPDAAASEQARRTYEGPASARGQKFAVQAGEFQASALSSSVVGSAGGVASVTSPGDPLAGARIEFPAGVLAGDTTISLTSAPVTAISGLPDGTAVRSRVIRLYALDAGGKPIADLARLVRITLPHEPTTDHVNFYKVEKGGVLEPVGFDSLDKVAHTVTFRTRAPGAPEVEDVPDATSPVAKAVPKGLVSNLTYASYVAIGLSNVKLSELLQRERAVDTGFLPSRNGWYIPNYGSYYRDSRGGNCFGMVGFAKFYYRQGYPTNMISAYRDPQKTKPWVDDAVAIELASRVHNGMSDLWDEYWNEEVASQLSATDVARSIVGALYVTRTPAMIYIQQVVGATGSGAHAIAFYRADLRADGSVTFHVHDPNKIADDSLRVQWAPGTGFGNYLSGTTAADSSFVYNYFRHVGYYVGMSTAQLLQAKADADRGFPASVFPKITVTKITGKALFDDVLANTGTTPPPASQPMFSTADTAVVIEGTVLGGNAQVAGQVVNNLRVITPSGNFSTPINNRAGGGDGKFSITIPLKSGINQIALMAADPSSVSNWAAFKEVLIESTAAPASFTVTLTWNRGTSDVDLYVREPNGAAGTPFAGKMGDIVYYSNRQGASTTNPYLDFDNTSGFGPEHFIVRQGMVTKFDDGTSSTSNNGTYRIGVHYYSWHGDDEEQDQSIRWNVNWRFLKACKAPCMNPETEGLWVTGSRAGVISRSNWQQDDPEGFYAGGASWSQLWDVEYPPPELIWTVPPSNTVMLP